MTGNAQEPQGQELTMSESESTMQAPSWTEIITPGRFDGKTVIVTGAGSGIGQAVALRIAREGGRVICSDLSQERLDALMSDHADLDLVTVTGDISTQDDV